MFATSAQLSSLYLEETGLPCFKSSLPSFVVRGWALLWLLYQPDAFDVAREHSWEAEERERRGTEPGKTKATLVSGANLSQLLQRPISPHVLQYYLLG